MRVYSGVMAGVTIDAAQDIFRLSAASDSVLILIRVEFTQDTLETSEMLPFSIYRASTDGTGTSVTPRPYEVQDSAFGGTMVVDLTAGTTKSPTEPLYRAGFNIGAGVLYHPVIEERIIVEPSGRIVGRVETAPGAALTGSLTVTFGELG